MCGRYTLRLSSGEIAELFRTVDAVDWSPCYNIAPTQAVLALRQPDAAEPWELTTFRWGLVPSWADDPKIGARMINARAETVAEKPSFRRAFRHRRCLVIADGFYEWQATSTGKQPYFIHRVDDRPFLFAGLWERWEKRGPALETCTILTTSPNALMSRLHHRMPVLLDESTGVDWVDPRTPESRLQGLLGPVEFEDWIAEPVSSHVNSPRHNDAGCIARIDL